MLKQEPATLRLHRVAELFAQLLNECPLLRSQLFRNRNRHADQQVAFSVAAEPWLPAFEFDDFAHLGSRWNL